MKLYAIMQKQVPTHRVEGDDPQLQYWFHWGSVWTFQLQEYQGGNTIKIPVQICTYRYKYRLQILVPLGISLDFSSPRIPRWNFQLKRGKRIQI